MDESQLPALLREALQILRAERMDNTRVDAIVDNWIYLWLPNVVFDETKYPPPHSRSLWVRIPLQFPFANPHGIITAEPLNPIDGHPIKGHNPNHDMCAPVRSLGGSQYYSWTWSGEIGTGPSLRNPRDILGVISWVERRIRQA